MTVWKWYHASLQSSKTNRALTCFGLGAEVHDFTEAAQQKLGWWPCQPITEWLRRHITTHPQCSITGPLFDEKFWIHETDLDFALALEIKEWALEQVEILLNHKWNDDTERALMADMHHAREWSEAEQIHLWEYNE